MNEKLKELLTSRRFGGSLASAVAAVLCYRYGLIDADKAAEWIEKSVGLYVAMIGGADVVKAWRDNGAQLVQRIPKAKTEDVASESES